MKKPSRMSIRAAPFVGHRMRPHKTEPALWSLHRRTALSTRGDLKRVPALHSHPFPWSVPLDRWTEEPGSAPRVASCCDPNCSTTQSYECCHRVNAGHSTFMVKASLFIGGKIPMGVDRRHRCL